MTLLASVAFCFPPRAESSLIEEEANGLLESAHLAGLVDRVDDPSFMSDEGFRVVKTGNRWQVYARGDAGFLYGSQELVLPCSVVGADGDPDFELRGAVLMMLSQSWDYQSELSPETFPWFFDRPLLTRYLDYLMSARLNTLVLWSGHLFPHILDLPEYPNASRFSRREIHRNQEQFRWLTTECAKRNITVLTHFYNIHVSEDLAKAMGRTGKNPTRYEEPDEFVTGYYRTILKRYFETFPNVGLYICPGESLALDQQQKWFESVIFRAAKESGKDPKLVIRDWTMDPDFQAALPGMYDNLYSELKHNDETITSPWPDLRHRKWKGVLKGHIVNLHDPADAVPYRVGSSRLFNEMVGRWKDEGFFMGSWFYPPQVWVWPYTVDRLPEGQHLLAFERDELWHLLEGRCLWKANRDVAGETKWAGQWLGRKFGNAETGRKLVAWYDLTGPILPGLQNLTAVKFGNFYPASIARMQADVDGILSARRTLDEGPLEGATGHTEQRYYSRPIDAYTIELYKERYHLDTVHDLRSMPIAQYAEIGVKGGSTDGYILPLKLLDLYVLMAEESLRIACDARSSGGNDLEEMQRFVQDSECLVYTAQYYRTKVQSAYAKRMLELTGDHWYADDLRRLMAESVEEYDRLIDHALRYYVAGSSMWDAKSWERTLEDKVKWDYEQQINWLKGYEAGIEANP